MKYVPLGFLIIVITLLLVSCRTTSQIDFSDTSPVYLSSPLYLSDLLEVDNRMTRYERNLFVGDIRYSGGVVNDPEKGMIIRTRNIELDMLRYFEGFSEALLDKVQGGLALRKIPYEMLTLQGPYSPKYRISDNPVPSKDEGRDNVNLPMKLYHPGPMDTDFLCSNGLAEGVLIVPIIEHAYSHMGGWFYNQWSGTFAGIRMTLHLAAIDVASGEVVMYDVKTLKYISKKGILSDYYIRQNLNQLLVEYQLHVLKL